MLASDGRGKSRLLQEDAESDDDDEDEDGYGVTSNQPPGVLGVSGESEPDTPQRGRQDVRRRRVSSISIVGGGGATELGMGCAVRMACEGKRLSVWD